MPANNLVTKLENNYPRMHDILFNHNEKSAEKMDRWIETLPEPKYPNFTRSPTPGKDDSATSSASDEEEGNDEKEKEVQEEKAEEVPVVDNRA